METSMTVFFVLDRKNRSVKNFLLTFDKGFSENKRFG